MQIRGAGMRSRSYVTTGYMLPDACSFPPRSSGPSQRRFRYFRKLRKGHALFSNSFCPLVLHFLSSVSQERKKKEKKETKEL